jgi:hypothetical protein
MAARLARALQSNFAAAARSIDLIPKFICM